MNSKHSKYPLLLLAPIESKILISAKMLQKNVKQILLLIIFKK